MNIYSGLLFLHGHIADPALARQLAAPPRSDTPRVSHAAQPKPAAPAPLKAPS